MFDSWSVISSLCGSALRPVPPLPEARREQAADHAAEAQEVQEPDHPGLQDPGSGLAGHGPGTVWCVQHNSFPFKFTFYTLRATVGSLLSLLFQNKSPSLLESHSTRKAVEYKPLPSV